MNKKIAIITLAVITLSLFAAAPVLAGTHNRRGHGFGRNQDLSSAIINFHDQGVVSAISGVIITLKVNRRTEYAVNATDAVITRSNGDPIKVSEINVGDVLSVYGTISGETYVQAAKIIDNINVRARFSSERRGFKSHAVSFRNMSKSYCAR